MARLCAASKTTAQLKRGTPGNVGHHCLTKCADLEYRGGNGYGLSGDWMIGTSPVSCNTVVCSCGADIDEEPGVDE